MLIILDRYYVAITFLISAAMQTSAFLVSFALQTDKMTDLMGSLNFFVLALFTLLAGGSDHTPRNLIASILVMIWATRLGSFLFYRVLTTGKDGRFDQMRSKFFSFGAFWLFQLFWCFIVSLPVSILNSPAAASSTPFGRATDIIGIIFWFIGFSIEVVGDQQKFFYKLKGRGMTRGSINDEGVWRWTRHPNFFGEILLWFGMYVLCLAPALSGSVSESASKALYGSAVSPIFITFLLFFVSGIPLAEKPTGKKYYLMTHGSRPLEGVDKWAEYKKYLNSTSIFFPIPPALYTPIPRIIKRTILLDFDMFQFDEVRDGPTAIAEEKANERS